MARPRVGAFRAGHHAAVDPCRNYCSLSVAGNLTEPNAEPDTECNPESLNKSKLNAIADPNAVADRQRHAKSNTDRDAVALAELIALANTRSPAPR